MLIYIRSIEQMHFYLIKWSKVEMFGLKTKKNSSIVFLYFSWGRGNAVVMFGLDFIPSDVDDDGQPLAVLSNQKWTCPTVLNKSLILLLFRSKMNSTEWLSHRFLFLSFFLWIFPIDLHTWFLHFSHWVHHTIKCLFSLFSFSTRSNLIGSFIHTLSFYVELIILFSFI